jgi:hypothetical protein
MCIYLFRGSPRFPEARQEGVSPDICWTTTVYLTYKRSLLAIGLNDKQLKGQGTHQNKTNSKAAACQGKQQTMQQTNKCLYRINILLGYSFCFVVVFVFLFSFFFFLFV